MKSRFTNHEKLAGEMIARELSVQAWEVYSNTDSIDVYVRDDRIYVRGLWDADDITLTELEELLLSLRESEEA